MELNINNIWEKNMMTGLVQKVGLKDLICFLEFKP